MLNQRRRAVSHQTDGPAANLERRRTMKKRIVYIGVGFLTLSLMATACGTITGGAIGAGTGAAIGAGTGYGAKKGAIIGGGAGAATGAVYDILH